MVKATAYYAEDIANVTGAARVELLKKVEEKQWAATWAVSRKHFDKLLELRELMGYQKSTSTTEEPEKFPDESTEDDAS